MQKKFGSQYKTNTKYNFLLKQTGTKVDAHRSRKTVMRKCVGFFFPPEFHIPISIPHMWLFFKMTILFKAGKKHNNPGIIYTKLGNLFFKDEANAEVASMFASRDSLTLYTQSAI